MLFSLCNFRSHWLAKHPGATMPPELEQEIACALASNEKAMLDVNHGKKLSKEQAAQFRPRADTTAAAGAKRA